MVELSWVKIYIKCLPFFCEYIALSQVGTNLLEHFLCVPVGPVFCVNIVHWIAWLFPGSYKMDKKGEGNCNGSIKVRNFQWGQNYTGEFKGQRNNNSCAT